MSEEAAAWSVKWMTKRSRCKILRRERRDLTFLTLVLLEKDFAKEKSVRLDRGRGVRLRRCR